MCTINYCNYCNVLKFTIHNNTNNTNNINNIGEILLNLGKHYKYINDNYKYKLMIKYYLMAIDKGNWRQ